MKKKYLSPEVRTVKVSIVNLICLSLNDDPADSSDAGAKKGYMEEKSFDETFWED